MSKFLRYSNHFDTILLKRIFVDNENRCKICAKKNKEKICLGKSSNERRHLLNHLSGDDLLHCCQEFVKFVKKLNESDSYDLIDLNKLYRNGDFQDSVKMDVSDDLFDELDEQLDEKLKEQRKKNKSISKRNLETESSSSNESDSSTTQKKIERKKKKSNSGTKLFTSSGSETDSSSTTKNLTTKNLTTKNLTTKNSPTRPKKTYQRVYTIYPLKR